MNIPTLALLLVSALAIQADTLIAQTPAAPGATPAVARKRHWEARFEELDTNRDGKLTLEEFLAGPMGKKTPEKAKTFFESIDKGHTGSITLDQWLAAHPEGEGGAEPEASAPAAPGAVATPAAPPAPVAPAPAPQPVRIKTMPLRNTPPVVEKALSTAMGAGGHNGKVEMFEEGGRTLYCVKFNVNGQMQEYTVDEAGAVARIRVYMDSVAKPIFKAINKHIGDSKVDIIEKCFDPGKVTYRVKFTTKDGKPGQMIFSESGVLQ